MEFNKAYNRNELVKFLRTSFIPEDFVQDETTLITDKVFEATVDTHCVVFNKTYN